MASTSIKAKLMTITPSRAAEWLEKGEANRRLKQRHIDRLVGIIVRDEWDPNNGETIKISRAGGVVDGQHRLWAIVESNKSVKALVAFNVPVKSFDTIDSGVGRSGLDTLVVDGIRTGTTRKYASILSATAKMLYALELAGSMPKLLNNGGRFPARVENKNILELVNRRPELYESATFVGSLPHVRGIHKSTMTFLHVVFNKKHSEKAARFMERLYSGEELSKGSPILALRNKLIALQGHRGAINGHPFLKFVIAITIKAWNAYRKNRSAKVLSWGETEKAPAPR